MSISFVINAGGKSSRLSNILGVIENKSWIEIRNNYCIYYNIKNIIDFVEEIIVIVRNDEQKLLFEIKLEELFHELDSYFKIKILKESDKEDLSGPLLGVETAIKSAKFETIFFAPNDHPYLDIEDYLEMQKYLTEDTIITIQNTKNNIFDPNMFVVNVNTLKKYKNHFITRITDLYRTIPNIIIIEKGNNLQTLYGINTEEDLKKIIDSNPKRQKTTVWLEKKNHEIHKVILKGNTKQTLEQEKKLWENISPLITSHIDKDLNNG